MILTGNLHLLIERHVALERVRICEKDTRGEGFHTRNASPIPLDVYQGEWLLYAYDLRHIQIYATFISPAVSLHLAPLQLTSFGQKLTPPRLSPRGSVVSASSDNETHLVAIGWQREKGDFSFLGLSPKIP